MVEVLVGVDRSEASRRAVEFAAERARLLGRDLLLVHVIPWSPFSFTTPTENEHRHTQREIEITAATEQVIEPLGQVIIDAGVKVRTLVRHGDPVDTIIELASREQCDQIVLGRTGDSSVRQKIFGSYPAQLVQEAPVPVTVVP